MYRPMKERGKKQEERDRRKNQLIVIRRKFYAVIVEFDIMK